ncbi:MAG: citrate/2-methylcitrate synthase, partial [Verrucomicrobiota bacterium]|nr:citrate/2-methylcitrate synthase [Verrucomicrobiota bacterium]
MSDTEKPVPAKGLEGVVAATTKLSSVRGLDGELIYRGYNINELAGKATYEEVVHLLHRGKLPNQSELDSLKAELAAARELPGGVVDLIKNLPKTASPMRAIRTVVSALACYEPPEAQDSIEDQTKR